MSMRNLFKTFTNAVLVIVGFFAVFFVAAKFMSDKNASSTAADSPDADTDDIDIGVVHADAPTG
jgi:hypothetical protein